MCPNLWPALHIYMYKCMYVYIYTYNYIYVYVKCFLTIHTSTLL